MLGNLKIDPVFFLTLLEEAAVFRFCCGGWLEANPGNLTWLFQWMKLAQRVLEHQEHPVEVKASSQRLVVKNLGNQLGVEPKIGFFTPQIIHLFIHFGGKLPLFLETPS